jgi:23S rRNA pseudouridine1911/1915/1917 synthase
VSTRHRFEVPDELDGLRLDRCLVELNPEWSRSRARALIDDGLVAAGGKPAKPSTVVRAGLELTVDEPDPEPLDLPAEDIPLRIVHEDPDLLVIDKPAGLVIHPAAGNPRGTLVNALLHHCRDLPGIGGVERPGIVHRLDKDTTGLLVVAKTDRAHLALSLAFRRREVEKSYVAVCYGHLHRREGVIEGAIDRHPRHRQQMAVVADGRPARTLYTVAEELFGTSVVDCRPVTGRTHQIRVHLAHIGHACVGDPLYAGRQWRNLGSPQQQTACRSFPRQALHARRIAFTHPASGQRVEFEAPVPRDMDELIETLRASPGH